MRHHCHISVMLFYVAFFFSSPFSFAQIPIRSLVNCERFPAAQVKIVRPLESPFIIIISSEEDLRNLNEKIRKAIKDGYKNIEVNIHSGTYYYDKLSVYLYNIYAPEVSISIKGNDAIMVPGGKEYISPSEVGALNSDYTYLDSKGERIDLYSEVFSSDAQVEVINAKTKLCRLRLTKCISFHSGMFIQLSEWFHTGFYVVQRIEGDYIYFIADDLEYNSAHNCYNVNLDYGVSKVYPRYRVWDPSKIYNMEGTIYECSVNSFLVLYQMKIRSFSISGLTFNGAAKASKNGLLYFREVEAQQINVHNCIFKNLNHRAVQLRKTDNFVFQNNQMKNCMYTGFYSYMDCNNTIVSDNYFYRMGRGWDNSSAVHCSGKNFLIANNLFEDCGYSSINVGAHRSWAKEKVTSGIIENNHIWFGDEYFKNGQNFNLIDGGAVYISTMNEIVIIRYNYIHNISGPGSNRAIYCDDGAMNVKIYGNIIRDIPNGYAVFSWRAKSINKEVPGSNDGIDFYYNVIWGQYRLEEKEGSSCIKGKNIVLYDDKLPETTIINFSYQEDDILSYGASVHDGIVVLARKASRELRKFPTYEGMKQWIQ